MESVPSYKFPVITGLLYPHSCAFAQCHLSGITAAIPSWSISVSLTHVWLILVVACVSTAHLPLIAILRNSLYNTQYALFNCILQCFLVLLELGNHPLYSHSLFPGIFPAQGSNPGLLHCRQILCCLSHKGNPYLILTIPQRSPKPMSSHPHSLPQALTTRKPLCLWVGLFWTFPISGITPRVPFCACFSY